MLCRNHNTLPNSKKMGHNDMINNVVQAGNESRCNGLNHKQFKTKATHQKQIPIA